MNTFQILAVLLALAAGGAYLNHQFLRLPATIGLMAISLLASITLVLAGELGWLDLAPAEAFVRQIPFADLLLHGMLGFLLFAGALHIHLDDLRSMKVPIAVLATVGVLMATAITGGLFWLAANWLGFALPFIYALLFGALISPTDPIAVLGILKKYNVSKELSTKIGGESLFNDGVGVVIFLTILSVATGQQPVAPSAVVWLLLREALGGAVLGLLLGWVTYRLLRSIDEYKTEVLLTLALVAGGYALAESLHVSAPIAIVAAGLLIGNQGRQLGMSQITREHVDMFWELVDEVLNAVLFMLIGLEILVFNVTRTHLLAGLLAILAVLIGRVVSVAIPIGVIRLRRHLERGTIRLLTWGGLRGGISIALALSLPAGPERELILAVTYVVVIFSILVQGLTFRYLIQALAARVEG